MTTAPYDHSVGQASGGEPRHVTASAAGLAERLPSWVTLIRAPNPGPMTLDGTNTWVLRAPGQAAIVIDPGPADDGHLAAIAALGPIGCVLLTHGHEDHSEAVPAMPVPLTRPVPGVAELLGFEVETLARPGHTADSICFRVRPAGAQEPPAVFTGDTILGRGTTVVAYPDGDLRDYLSSLARLSSYNGELALPGHGPALADCGAAARFYADHRRARLAQVRAAVAGGARTAPDVVAVVYADVDRALWPAAEMSVAAQLAYLDRETDPVRRESHPPADGLGEA